MLHTNYLGLNIDISIDHKYCMNKCTIYFDKNTWYNLGSRSHRLWKVYYSTSNLGILWWTFSFPLNGKISEITVIDDIFEGLNANIKPY